MSKKIQLYPHNQNKFVLVDDGDFHRVQKLKWYFEEEFDKEFAYSLCGNGRRLYLHDFLVAVPQSDVGHINSNGLDNRRCNLSVSS